MNQRQLTCIGCPMGCQLTATIENGVVTAVTGNTCKRGDSYARKECVAHALNTALAHLPIAAGDVVIPDVCGTGVNVIATKSAK